MLWHCLLWTTLVIIIIIIIKVTPLSTNDIPALLPNTTNDTDPDPDPNTNISLADISFNSGSFNLPQSPPPETPSKPPPGPKAPSWKRMTKTADSIPRPPSNWNVLDGSPPRIVFGDPSYPDAPLTGEFGSAIVGPNVMKKRAIVMVLRFLRRGGR